MQQVEFNGRTLYAVSGQLSDTGDECTFFTKEGRALARWYTGQGGDQWTSLVP